QFDRRVAEAAADIQHPVTVLQVERRKDPGAVPREPADEDLPPGDEFRGEEVVPELDRLWRVVRARAHRLLRCGLSCGWRRRRRARWHAAHRFLSASMDSIRRPSTCGGRADAMPPASRPETGSVRAAGRSPRAPFSGPPAPY